MKRTLIAIVLVLFAGSMSAADAAEAAKALSVRTFQFKYKDADKAAAVIKPLISSEGSMSIQPATNALIVTDRPDVLKAVEAAIAAFDAAPRPIKLSIHIIAAGKTAAAPAPAALKETAAKLALLGYKSVESLGQANIEGREGEPGFVDLATGYRAEFRFGEIDTASDSVKLNDFKLSRLQKDQLVQLYKASLNLRIGQTLMFGVTKAQGERALFLVFVAHR